MGCLRMLTNSINYHYKSGKKITLAFHRHFTGIPERKDLGSFEAPVIKLSKKFRVGLSGRKEIRAL